ncbi:MAG: phytanoyl-CoA dioxygenase family protein [Alphaproteobacteria bacterium]|nr:phytanoyl-CoA dioxygenase family protein [Alphaproteobacteria bacterium]
MHPLEETHFEEPQLEDTAGEGVGADIADAGVPKDRVLDEPWMKDPARPAARVPRHAPAFDPDDAPPPALDESAWLALPPAEAARVAADLPLSTRFRLRAELTPVQLAFLDRHGFAVFDRVASREEVETILAEVDLVEEHLVRTGKDSVFGVPVWTALGDDGRDFLVRMGFTHVLSPWLAAFVQDDRFDPVRRLIGDDARIGLHEKDGVVFNRYIQLPGTLRESLGWHTDALRDVFYNRKMPGPMLNVGLHFDRIRPQDGGLRVLPGTHTQSAFSTLFRKIHFVSMAADRDEIAVETWPGDLTVHDGRMWHRVEAPTAHGWQAQRRSMYVPYVRDSYQPKDEQSQPLLYQRLFDRVLAWQKARKKKQLTG